MPEGPALPEAVTLSSETDDIAFRVELTPEDFERWKAHPLGPGLVDVADDTEMWGIGCELFSAQCHILSSDEAPRTVPDVPTTRVTFTLYPIEMEVGEVAYEFADIGRKPKHWPAACTDLVEEYLRCMAERDWPPDLGSTPTEPPQPHLTPERPEREGFLSGSVVEPWYRPCRIDLQSAMTAAQNGRSPFGDPRNPWRTDELNDLVLFWVPMYTIAWKLELFGFDAPRWLESYRSWLEIGVERSTEEVQTPQGCTTTPIGDVDDAPRHDFLEDRFRELAYRAYRDLVDDFVREEAL